MSDTQNKVAPILPFVNDEDVPPEDRHQLYTYFCRIDQRQKTVNMVKCYEVLMPAEYLAHQRALNAHTHAFSISKANRICELIGSGYTVKKILQIDGMPDRWTFNSWRRKIKEFDDMLKAAEEDRADELHDRLLELATKAESAMKDEVAGLKLSAEIVKWAAGVGNKRKYEAKPIQEQVQQPNITIKIDTGSKELDNMTYELSDSGELKGFEYGKINTRIAPFGGDIWECGGSASGSRQTDATTDQPAPEGETASEEGREKA